MVKKISPREAKNWKQLTTLSEWCMPEKDPDYGLGMNFAEDGRIWLKIPSATLFIPKDKFDKMIDWYLKKQTISK